MNQRLIMYIENSFLKPLLDVETITDISYNGVSIFFMDNVLGRRKYDVELSTETVVDFVRQVANLSERQFSFTSPNLDVSISRYRINAQHSSIVRVGDEKSVSFSIRIATKEIRIDESDKFIEKEAREILLNAIKNKQSIVIAGPTGSGKTELQKYLISQFENFTRIIIIDNVQELEYVRFNPDLDITSWQISPTIPQGSAQELIRNALRNNPDWLVVAESRGKEMNDALNAVMTGHPIITTLHAKSIEAIPHRMMRMVQMGKTEEKAEDILDDIYSHIDYYVYLNRRFDKDKNVERFVESIAVKGEGHNLNIIYRRKEKVDEENRSYLHSGCSNSDFDSISSDQ